MNKEMEHAIGTKITLEVVEGISCKDCFFHAIKSCSKIRCRFTDREDSKNIMYKEVKDMKTLDEYTIYCTEEQTRKAHELGAKIKDGNDINLYDKHDDTNCLYAIPTAEQMIGWLEKKGVLIEIYYNSTYRHYNYCKKYGGRGNWGCALYDSYTKGFSSRPEATLAAIDSALDYLIKNKK